MTAELALKAVLNACLNVPNLEGIILQSDLGSQYTSEVFEKHLAETKSVIRLAAKAVRMTMPV